MAKDTAKAFVGMKNLEGRGQKPTMAGKAIKKPPMKGKK
jgi:hypothetical protein